MHHPLESVRFWVYVWLPFSLAVHEAAHAHMAWWSGDDSVSARLTLNPLKHLEPIGACAVPLVTALLSRGQFWFVAAKPVFWCPQRCRKPRVAEALVGVSGPGANLLMSLAAASLLALLGSGTPILDSILRACIGVNLMLFVLNMVPIPPLDGAHVWLPLIPDQLAQLRSGLEWAGLVAALGCVVVLPIATGWDPVGQCLRAALGVLFSIVT